MKNSCNRETSKKKPKLNQKYLVTPSSKTGGQGISNYISTLFNFYYFFFFLWHLDRKTPNSEVNCVRKLTCAVPLAKQMPQKGNVWWSRPDAGYWKAREQRVGSYSARLWLCSAISRDGPVDLSATRNSPAIEPHHPGICCSSATCRWYLLHLIHFLELHDYLTPLNI